jgi:hypothetical protein
MDNDPTRAEVFRGAVLAAKSSRFRAEGVRALSEGLRRLREKEIWAVFVNLYLPDTEGLVPTQHPSRFIRRKAPSSSVDATGYPADRHREPLMSGPNDMAIFLRPGAARAASITV